MLMTMISEDPRWAQVRARDASADGRFVYSVATTGVYCRPSCASRPANPKNVRFHNTPAEAEAAGFRACLRCRPNEAPGARLAGMIADACRRIETAEETPALAELAEGAGMSPGHFHRLFKAATGVTPKAYAAQVKAGKFRAALGEGGSVTNAIYDAGYGSSSRVYEKSDAMLGMTPGGYRAGGKGTRIRFAIAESSLGSVLVASSERGVCAILMGDDAQALVHDLQDRFPRAMLIGADADYEKVVAQVIGLVEDPAKRLDLPLDVRGTAFQQRVWQALRAIPPGTTATYSEIAAAIGAPSSTRAVAGACAANAHAIAIPCHRVVRTDGSLSGYRWGVARKRELLTREAAHG